MRCLDPLIRHATLCGLAAALVFAIVPKTGAESVDEPLELSSAEFTAPTLRYSTTVGGGVGEGRAMVRDANGNTVIAGVTSEKSDFALVNAADSDPGSSGSEGFVTKINAAGDDVVFSTYLGGERDDWLIDVDVDPAGNIYVVGVTQAIDFPTTPGSLQPTIGHSEPEFGSTYDGFVTKLDPSGNIVWSTYLGGDKNDEAYGVRAGADGSVYVVGMSDSFDFPTTQDAYQKNCNGQFDLCHDAFVVRIAPNGGSLTFGTFLGGQPFGEAACDVDVDETGHVFVVGHYVTDGFPYVNPFQDFHDAGSDWFVTKFAPDGESLVWSSGLGGNGQDAPCNRFQIGPSIALDGNGDAFVGGLTTSTNLTASGTFQTAFGGTTDGYLAKIGSAGTLEWGTYFGGEANDSINDIAVLGDGSPAIVGSSNSLDFPATADALEENDCASATVFCSVDAFAAVFTSDGTDLQFSTQLGGSDTDEANGIAIGADGALVLAGTTGTELWPLVNPLPEPLRGDGGTLIYVAEIGDDAAPIPGDANGDGSVTASDALAALSVALGARECLLCICDLNGDGGVTATDALLILNMAVGATPPINPPSC